MSKYSLATAEDAKIILKEANDWIKDTIMWNESKCAAKMAVAEYIANKQNLTLYKINT